MTSNAAGGWNATHWYEDWVAAGGADSGLCPWCGAHESVWDRDYPNRHEPHVGGIDRHGRCTGCGSPEGWWSRPSDGRPAA